MGLYSDSDILSSVEGDIVLNNRGDIDIGDSIETYRAVANFLIRTDQFDYAPDTKVGSNLGSFIGEHNTSEIHEQMRKLIINSLSRVFNSEDYKCNVVHFDINEAVVYVYLAGTYLIDNEYQNFSKERLTFLFPYIDGEPTPLTTNS